VDEKKRCRTNKEEFERKQNSKHGKNDKKREKNDCFSEQHSRKIEDMWYVYIPHGRDKQRSQVPIGLLFIASCLLYRGSLRRLKADKTRIM